NGIRDPQPRVPKDRNQRRRSGHARLRPGASGRLHCAVGATMMGDGDERRDFILLDVMRATTERRGFTLIESMLATERRGFTSIERVRGNTKRRGVALMEGMRG